MFHLYILLLTGSLLGVLTYKVFLVQGLHKNGPGDKSVQLVNDDDEREAGASEKGHVDSKLEDSKVDDDAIDNASQASGESVQRKRPTK